MSMQLIGVWAPRILPEEQWIVQFHGNGVAVAAHVNGPEPGYLYWTNLPLSELPRDLFEINNLSQAIVGAIRRKLDASSEA
jgi:hypothetical protein